MRTETITKEIFSFDELSEAAKANARDWYRGCIEADEIGDTCDWQAIAAILGIDFATRAVKLYGGGTRQEPCIYWSGFSSQGDGASFTGWYAYAKGAPAAIRAYAPQDRELHRIADELQAVQRRHFYRLQASISSGNNLYNHSGTMRADVTRTDEADVSADDQDTVQQLMRDYADWIYHQLEAQWDYLNSDESIDESIECNGYEFDAAGRIA